MTLSKAAQDEIRELARSKALKNDMAIVAGSQQGLFVHEGIADADAYIEFVTAFNEFINPSVNALPNFLTKKACSI